MTKMGETKRVNENNTRFPYGEALLRCTDGENDCFW